MENREQGETHSMAGRHFVRRGRNAELAGGSETSSGSDSDSAADGKSGVLAVANVEEASLRQVEHKIESRDQASSDTSEEDSTSSDSSDDDDGTIKLHRPIFLKNLNYAKKLDENEVQKTKEETESKKRLSLIQKVEHENRVLVAQQDAKRQIDNNYSTDKVLMESAMMLDDNDAIDPSHEKQEWLRRQELRKKERRDKLVAIQLELEEYEANKLRFSKDDKSTPVGLVSELKPKTRPKIDSSKQYRPSRLKEAQFANLENKSLDTDVTEYSIL